MKKKKPTCAFDKYTKFAADFETTYHKNWSQSEILEYDRSTLGLTPNNKTLDEKFTPNESSQVFLCGLWQLEKNEYRLSYENLTDFFSNISNLTFLDHHKQALVYFHNLAYDGSYILNWLLQHHWEQTLAIDEITGQPIILKNQFAMLKSGGKFFNLMFFWKGIKIIFLDSLKLFPTTLENLGVEIGFPKLKELVDYTKFKLHKLHHYPKEWLEYLKRDCEILAKYLALFFKNEKKAKSLNRPTIGSISYSYIKSVVDKLTPFTVADYELFQNWFHGGLTFPSFNYWAKWVYAPNRIKMIDRVSMYPTQMTKMLPYGEPLKNPPSGLYTTYYKVHIESAIINSKFNDIAILWKPFFYKNNKKYTIATSDSYYQYLQEVYDQDYYFIDKEFDILKEIYDIKYKVIDKWYFKLDNYLKPFIDKMFLEKKNAKNTTIRTLAKLKLNNLYGKLGQKPIREQDFYGPPSQVTEQYKICGEKSELNNGFIIEKIKQPNDKAQPIFIAAYITALSRVDLITKYLELRKKGCTFLYCDTDSLAFIDTPKGVKLDDIGKELGQWEYEKFGVADAFCSLCPKQYRIVKNKQVVKLASAGLAKSLMLEVKNQDYNYDLGENKNYKIYKRTLKNSVNGKVIFDSPFNFIKWKKYKDNPIIPKELIN